MLKKIIVILIVVIVVVSAVAVLAIRGGTRGAVNGVLVDKNTTERIGDVDGAPIRIDDVVVDKSGDLVYVLPSKNAKVNDGQPIIWIE